MEAPLAKDLVIVPAYWRPEYLDRCLEKLYLCPGAEQRDVWVFQDHRFGDQNKFASQSLGLDAVIDKYRRKDGFRYILREPHKIFGNSYNLLSAYQEAYASKYRYVFLIEEDVLVSRGFFSWHETVQTASSCFVSLAWRPDRYSMENPSADPGYFLQCGVYCSIGVCWKRENLKEVTTLAYHNVRMHGEQDCQIRELMNRNGYVAACAYKQRAFHIGATGNQRVLAGDADCDIFPEGEDDDGSSRV